MPVWHCLSWFSWPYQTSHCWWTMLLLALRSLWPLHILDRSEGISALLRSVSTGTANVPNGSTVYLRYTYCWRICFVMWILSPKFHNLDFSHGHHQQQCSLVFKLIFSGCQFKIPVHMIQDSKNTNLLHLTYSCLRVRCSNCMTISWRP